MLLLELINPTSVGLQNRMPPGGRSELQHPQAYWRAIVRSHPREEPDRRGGIPF